MSVTIQSAAEVAAATTAGPTSIATTATTETPAEETQTTTSSVEYQPRGGTFVGIESNVFDGLFGGEQRESPADGHNGRKEQFFRTSIINIAFAASAEIAQIPSTLSQATTTTTTAAAQTAAFADPAFAPTPFRVILPGPHDLAADVAAFAVLAEAELHPFAVAVAGSRRLSIADGRRRKFGQISQQEEIDGSHHDTEHEEKNIKLSRTSRSENRKKFPISSLHFFVQK